MSNLTEEGIVSRRGHSETLREASKDKPATIESFPVDETPTPTKILKMADEVGLFHDLRDNPFDAHFRKATEAVKLGADSLTASIAATEIPEEESLNTPHIYPAPGDNPSTAPAPRPVLLRANSRSRPLVPLTARLPFVPVASVLPVKTSGFKAIAPNGPVSTVVGCSVLQQTSHASAPAGSVLNPGSQEGTENALLLLKFPSGETIKLSNLPFVKEEPSAAGGVILKSPAKLKLKETLINNTNSAAFASKRTNADTISDLAVVEARESNYELGITAGPPLSKKIRSSSVDEVDKKKDIQERNRASAQRSRNKKRDEFDKTLKKCKELEKKTGMLEMENSILREEVVKLKSLLIKHANCQITRDYNEQEKVKSIVEPRVVLPVRTDLKYISLSEKYVQQRKSPIVTESPEKVNSLSSIVVVSVEDPQKINLPVANTTVYTRNHIPVDTYRKLSPPTAVLTIPKTNSTSNPVAPSECFRKVNPESSQLSKEPELDAPINLTSGCGSRIELPQVASNIIKLTGDQPTPYSTIKDPILNESPPQTVPEDLRVDHSKIKVNEPEHNTSSVSTVNEEITQIPSPGYVRVTPNSICVKQTPQGYVRVTPNSICVKQTLARHCQRVVSEKHETREKKGQVAKRLKDKLFDLKMKMGEGVDSHEHSEASTCTNV